jgi:hypothetical protein
VFISIEPDHARPDEEVTVVLQGPGAEGWIGDLYANLEAEWSDGWRTVFHLTGIAGLRSEEFPPPIKPGRTRFELSVGINGPIRFQVPLVRPGTYRLGRKYVQPGPQFVVLYCNIVVTE